MSRILEKHFDRLVNEVVETSLLKLQLLNGESRGDVSRSKVGRGLDQPWFDLNGELPVQ